MDRIKIMPTVDTKSDVMVIADSKEETIQRFIKQATESYLKVKMNCNY